MSKLLEIRNSTAEFLTFVAANQEDGVQVVYLDETIWATQAAMGELFDVSSKTINEHLSNIFNEGELIKDRTIRKIQVVQLEGERKINREPMFYNLDAIISVGYRDKSNLRTSRRRLHLRRRLVSGVDGFLMLKARIKRPLSKKSRNWPSTTMMESQHTFLLRVIIIMLLLV